MFLSPARATAAAFAIVSTERSARARVQKSVFTAKACAGVDDLEVDRLVLHRRAAGFSTLWCLHAHLASCTYRTCGTSNFLTVNRLALFWNLRSEVSVSNYKRSAAGLT